MADSEKVVWKFDVTPDKDGDFEIPLPKGSKVLTAGYDGRGLLCLWIEIQQPFDTHMMPKRKFMIVPTGKVFTENVNYIATVFKPTYYASLGMNLAESLLVFHVYEILEEA